MIIIYTIITSSFDSKSLNISYLCSFSFLKLQLRLITIITTKVLHQSGTSRVNHIGFSKKPGLQRDHLHPSPIQQFR